VNSLDDKVYDLRGLKCPLPVLKTEKRLRGMPSGAILTVATSDPLAIIDIPHFCSENGHALVASDKTDNGHRFVICKG
jgi:tRNA 2-thiouridine synthesizing protein A